jgi:hypothetical protein
MAKKFDAKAKAKRQKIIAAVGGVILLAVLAYEVPSLMKTMNKKPPPAAVAVTPTPVTPVPGVVPGTPVSAPVASATLSDSDPAAQAGSGQLLSFDRFPTKDPFVQQANTAKAPPASDTPVAPPPPPPPPPPPTGSTPSAAKRTSAQISINGAKEQVNVDATFPAADPVFHLLSLTKTTAKVGIAGGSLSSGNAVTLTKGKKVTLMNTADGTRYELVLVSTS